MTKRDAWDAGHAMDGVPGPRPSAALNTPTSECTKRAGAGSKDRLNYRPAHNFWAGCPTPRGVCTLKIMDRNPDLRNLQHEPLRARLAPGQTGHVGQMGMIKCHLKGTNSQHCIICFISNAECYQLDLWKVIGNIPDKAKRASEG